MDLEDLVLKKFRVEKVDGRMLAILDPAGRYRASNAQEVEVALSTDQATAVDVLIGNKWYQIRGNRVCESSPKVTFSKPTRNQYYLEGYQAGYRAGNNSTNPNPSGLKEE